MKIEKWVDVFGYKGLYQVSNYGNVKSFHKSNNGSILNLNKSNRGGYFFVILNLERTKKTILVHRLVASHFIPNNENKATVNHIDGNKNNNFVENLEWCSLAENIKHAWDTGIYTPFKREYSRSLTQKQADELRLLKNTKTYRELKEIFGLSRSAMTRIVKNKTYSL